MKQKVMTKTTSKKSIDEAFLAIIRAKNIFRHLTLDEIAELMAIVRNNGESESWLGVIDHAQAEQANFVAELWRIHGPTN